MLVNLGRARDLMERAKLDVLIGARAENTYYLSDFGPQHAFTLETYGWTAAVLPRDEDTPATLIVSEVDVPALSQAPSWMPETRMIQGFTPHVPDPARLTEAERRTHDLWQDLRRRSGPAGRDDLMARAVADLGLSGARVGVDDEHVLRILRERPELSGVELVPAQDLLREIRRIKTPEEVELLRRSVAVNEQAMLRAVAATEEGMTLRDVGRRWRAEMAALDAHGIDVTTGGLERPWNTYPDDYVLRSGDHAIFDSGGTYRRYWSDTGRIMCIGEPEARVRELHAALVEAHEAVSGLLRPGVSTDEIGAAARAAVSGLMEDGFYAAVTSMGLEYIDNPQQGWSFELEAGMVVNFETLYFEFPWGLMQLEETWHIEPDGAERLSALPQELLAAGMPVAAA
ncbi:MAG: Xaa-Pro dipeptidase [Solirubrobacteraceae bacterium]|nr:Xaa-Pro dipeptidase [Solirubrobacteraceae bacterium]